MQCDFQACSRIIQVYSSSAKIAYGTQNCTACRWIASDKQFSRHGALLTGNLRNMARKKRRSATLNDQAYPRKLCGKSKFFLEFPQHKSTNLLAAIAQKPLGIERSLNTFLHVPEVGFLRKKPNYPVGFRDFKGNLRNGPRWEQVEFIRKLTRH